MVQLLQANLNLNQDERLLEAVRRHRDLWHMRSWQPERRTVLEMMSTCCGKSSCYWILQLLGQQHGCAACQNLRWLVLSS